MQCEDPLGRIRELLAVRDKIYTECADIILDANRGYSDELAEELQLQLRKLKEAPKKKEREKKMKILVINGIFIYGHLLFDRNLCGFCIIVF